MSVKRLRIAQIISNKKDMEPHSLVLKSIVKVYCTYYYVTKAGS
jgi:hypothetical protein